MSKKKITKKMFEEDMRKGVEAGAAWIDEGNRYDNYQIIAEGRYLQLTLDGMMGFLEKVRSTFWKRYQAYGNEKDHDIVKIAVKTLTELEDNEAVIRFMNKPLFTKEEEAEMNMTREQMLRKAIQDLRDGM